MDNKPNPQLEIVIDEAYIMEKGYSNDQICQIKNEDLCCCNSNNQGINNENTQYKVPAFKLLI